MLAAAATALVWLMAHSPELSAQPHTVRLAAGRFTVVAAEHDRRLAEALLRGAVARDSYPGLPRPTQPVLVQIAADRRQFRALVGPHAPEWGAAITLPEEHRVVMQGQRAGSDAGDPIEVLRHELAHLALHENLGDLPPRWFDEGYASYAAGEWSREQVLETNLALALRGTPTFDRLEEAFSGGAESAQRAYALAYRAVAELAALDPEHGLANLFVEWKRSGRLDPAVRAAYGITLAGFEQRWQQRTRRRYGVLALFAELTAATAMMLVIVLPLYAIRKRRDRQRMAALLAADRAAEAEDVDVLGVLLGEGEPTSADAPAGGGSPPGAGGGTGAPGAAEPGR